MSSLSNLFNNREIAIGIWTFLFVVWVLTAVDKKSLTPVVKAFFVKPIVISLVLMISYIVLMILGFRTLGYWNESSLKETVLWSFGVAFVMLMNTNAAHEDEHYFKKVILDSVSWVIVLEFITNLYVFNLWIELLLVPVATVLLMLRVVAGTKPSYKQVDALLERLLTVIGLGMAVFAVYGLISDIQGFATPENMRDFLLPPVFTLTFLPFVYFAALYSEYELVFMRLRVQNTKRESVVRYATWRILLTFRLNFHRLNRWSKRVRSLHIQSEADVAELLKL